MFKEIDLTLLNKAVKHLDATKQEEIKSYVSECVATGNVYEETRLHSKDQFRADNSPKEVLSLYKELNRKAVFLTQHGVAAMVWDYKPLAEESGLKFIPGVETDYQEEALKADNGLMIQDDTKPISSLVLHALNDDGWKAIGMAISASQTLHGKSLMNDDILVQFFGKGAIGHGNVVLTTGGMEGVLAQIIKEGSLAKEAIKNILLERDRKTGGEIPDSYFKRLQDKIDELTDEEAVLKETIKTLEKTAKENVKNQNKEVKAFVDKGDQTSEEYINACLQLSVYKKELKTAEKEAEELSEKHGKIKKRISALKKEYKDFEKLKAQNEVYEEKVNQVEEQVTSEEEIYQKAKKKLIALNELFGAGNVFVEIQNHGSKEQERVFPDLISLAKSLDVPLLATNDVHMLNQSEEEVLKRQILKTTEFPKNPKWFELTPSEKEMYIKSDEEMVSALSELYDEDVVAEAMLNTLVLVARADVQFKVVNHHPKFIDDTGRTSVEIFKDLINKGIEKRFPNGLDEAHQKRLDHEFGVMESMGYIDYHLVVNDFNQYASEYDAIPFDKIPEAPLNRKDLQEWKDEHGFHKPIGLTNGTGRGSAVGSLICDLLGITHLDPMKYELLFERFLNPERVSMPDIDSDISRTVRPIVIDYVRNKYGEDCVAGIMTQNSQAPKGAIRIAGKAYGLYLHRNDYKDNGAKRFLSLADKIAKLVPETPGISFKSKMSDDKDSLSVYDYLIKEFSADKEALRILEWSKYIEGCFTAYGSHAAGIVITDGAPVSEIVPLRWNDKLKLYTTQCDMVVAEEIGMLKFDMLGLKTIDIINDTLWEMNKSGVVMDTNQLPLDDAEVYANIFAKGKTDSVFQFESPGMKQMLKRFQPENFEDLIILVSMFRPGPLQYLDDVIDVKHGRKPLTFLTKELEPILGATYGAITYQEQVMQIFQQLAGYTLGGADLVRRFMSKKKADKLAKEREAFINGDASRGIVGCVGNGIDKDAAGKLFDQMTEFAKYAFNKSHAAAYAYNAYITGYLKHHYPAEFMMGAMRWAEKQGSYDPIPSLMAEAKSMGIEVMTPDINHSGVNFNVDNGKILFGLGSVASVASYSKEITEERRNGKYVDFFDYFKRTSAKKDATKNLILAGAFDAFHNNRKAMVAIVDQTQAIAKKLKEKEHFVEVAKAMLPFIDFLETKQEVIDRQEELGYKPELKDVTTSKKLAKRIENAKAAIKELHDDFKNVKFPTDITEDIVERLNAERKFVGAYITAHPLDGYETAASLGIKPLLEVDEDTTEVFGLITSVSVKNRKKDGKPMAFITIEDEVTNLRVNVFTTAYEHNKNLIELGSAVQITGTTKVSEIDDEGNPTYEFNAKTFTLVKKKQKGMILSVSSLAMFHILEEDSFRAKYESPLGSPLYIQDLSLKELRQMNYKVSPKALEYNGVKEI